MLPSDKNYIIGYRELSETFVLCSPETAFDCISKLLTDNSSNATVLIYPCPAAEVYFAGVRGRPDTFLFDDSEADAAARRDNLSKYYSHREVVFYRIPHFNGENND